MEVGVEADTTIEEPVLLGESTLKRELGLGVLGCHEGVYSPEYFPSPEERPSTPLPPLEDQQDVDRSYGLPCVTCEPIQSPPVQEPILPPRTTDTPQSPEKKVCFSLEQEIFYCF